VEIDLGIAYACAPTLKPLFLRWFPNILDSVFGHPPGTSRKALVGGTANFVLMDSPRRTSGGRMVEMENASRVYGNSESQERIYNPSTTPPQSRDLRGLRGNTKPMTIAGPGMKESLSLGLKFWEPNRTLTDVIDLELRFIYRIANPWCRIQGIFSCTRDGVETARLLGQAKYALEFRPNVQLAT
jgi:hypothetical protein